MARDSRAMINIMSRDSHRQHHSPYSRLYIVVVILFSHDIIEPPSRLASVGFRGAAAFVQPNDWTNRTATEKIPDWIIAIESVGAPIHRPKKKKKKKKKTAELIVTSSKLFIPQSIIWRDAVFVHFQLRLIYNNQLGEIINWRMSDHCFLAA
jgi:hypothetical protein